MTHFREHKLTISEHLLWALEYGALEGYHYPDDARICEQFYHQYPGALIECDREQESGFAKCQLTGISADCVDITVLVPLEQVSAQKVADAVCSAMQAIDAPIGERVKLTLYFEATREHGAVVIHTSNLTKHE